MFNFDKKNKKIVTTFVKHNKVFNTFKAVNYRLQKKKIIKLLQIFAKKQTSIEKIF